MTPELDLYLRRQGSTPDYPRVEIPAKTCCPDCGSKRPAKLQISWWHTIVGFAEMARLPILEERR